MKEFETLTKELLQKESEHGRLLCEWKCKGSKENEEYGGWCIFLYYQNRWEMVHISGNDLKKGGITYNGEFWFADYDYLVQARIFTNENIGDEEYNYIKSKVTI